MENAVQALKIGAAILVFSIAIATVFLIFAQARQVSETVFLSMDNDSYMEYVEGDFSTINRVVGVETVISTLYNYYKETACVTIIIDKAGNVIKYIDTANNVLDSTQIKPDIDKFVNEKLLGTSLKNSQFEETFYEEMYNGNIYIDKDTLETIQDINTKIKIYITYREI